MTKHLFGECAWFRTIEEAMMQWAGIKLQSGGVRQVLLEIKMKHWKTIQKDEAHRIESCFVESLYIQREPLSKS